MKQFDIDKLQEGMSEYRELVEEVRTEIYKNRKYGSYAALAEESGITRGMMYQFVNNYVDYDLPADAIIKLYKILSKG